MIESLDRERRGCQLVRILALIQVPLRLDVSAFHALGGDVPFRWTPLKQSEAGATSILYHCRPSCRRGRTLPNMLGTLTGA